MSTDWIHVVLFTELFPTMGFEAVPVSVMGRVGGRSSPWFQILKGIHGIGPCTTQSLDATFSVIKFPVFLVVLSTKLVVTAAPSVVLDSMEFVLQTRLPTRDGSIPVPLWAMLQIAAAVVLVASHVCLCARNRCCFSWPSCRERCWPWSAVAMMVVLFPLRRGRRVFARS